MLPSPRLTIPLLLSLAVHAIFFFVVISLDEGRAPQPEVTPVTVVNLPKDALRRLPPLDRPDLTRPPGPLPVPKKFGPDDAVRLPKTVPETHKPGPPGEGEREGGLPAPKEKGPLPFLTQRDIDDLARRGMPPKRPGDDSVTLDTDEFKFISYNRWLKIKVEGVLKYPELAAVSGYQGVAYIRFDIMKDGSLGALELLKSSGYKILDDEALRSIRSSAPFAPLPVEWHMERYPIRAAVIFYINEAYVR